MSVDTTGLTVADPSGAIQPAHFLFSRMESWGVGKGSDSIVINTPRGPFEFSCAQSQQLARKLTDIAHMIMHSEPGHAASHAAGAPPAKGQGEWFKGEIVQDPLGVGLPQSCLLRVLPASLCINGRGTKDSLKIQLRSMQGWGHSANGDLSITLIAEKGGGTFIFNMRQEPVAVHVSDALGAAATNMAAQRDHAAPPPPPSYHPPRTAHGVESETHKQVQITIPKGCKPGNTLVLNDPELGKVKIKIPEGAKAGNILKVNLKRPVRKAMQDGGAMHAHPPPPPPHHGVAAAASPAAPISSGDVKLKITIPAGARVGQTLSINTPNHGKVQITVPAGKGPGDSIILTVKGGAVPPPRAQQLVITVPPGSGPGSKLKANYGGRSFMVTVPKGIKPGQKMKVNIPANLSRDGGSGGGGGGGAAAPPPPPPPKERVPPQHKLGNWSDRAKQQVRTLLNQPSMPEHDVIELLDMADGDVNRAVNMHFNMLSHNQAQASGSQDRPRMSTMESMERAPPGPSNRRKSFAPINPGPPRAPPPPAAAGTPPAAPPSARGSHERGSHTMAFSARSYASNDEFGFPENVTLSLARGHFTVLDEDGDDLAAWPMGHVHDWKLEGKHDVTLHVPEGTLEFGVEEGEALLTKLAVLHAALA
jgi:hypothetical protein